MEEIDEFLNEKTFRFEEMEKLLEPFFNKMITDYITAESVLIADLQPIQFGSYKLNLSPSHKEFHITDEDGDNVEFQTNEGVNTSWFTSKKNLIYKIRDLKLSKTAFKEISRAIAEMDEEVSEKTIYSLADEIFAKIENFVIENKFRHEDVLGCLGNLMNFGYISFNTNIDTLTLLVKTNIISFRNGYDRAIGHVEDNIRRLYTTNLSLQKSNMPWVTCRDCPIEEGGCTKCNIVEPPTSKNYDKNKRCSDCAFFKRDEEICKIGQDFQQCVEKEFWVKRPFANREVKEKKPSIVAACNCCSNMEEDE